MSCNDDKSQNMRSFDNNSQLQAFFWSTTALPKVGYFSIPLYRPVSNLT